MNESTMKNVATTQRRRYYASVSMNESTTVNVTTTQRRRYYVGISMNESIIANVVMPQCRRFYANILMNESTMTNVLTTQRRRCCSFDSPGLARNEPTLGKHSQGDSTPQVLSFFLRKHDYSERIHGGLIKKAQHRRYYASVSMNESIIANVVMPQCRRFYANILMNESTMTNVLTTQRRRCCSFDSPGLARNEPTLGKQGDSTL